MASMVANNMGATDNNNTNQPIINLKELDTYKPDAKKTEYVEEFDIKENDDTSSGTEGKTIDLPK